VYATKALPFLSVNYLALFLNKLVYHSITTLYSIQNSNACFNGQDSCGNIVTSCHELTILYK